MLAAWHFGGGFDSLTGLENWVMLVLLEYRTKMFDLATLKSFM